MRLRLPFSGLVLSVLFLTGTIAAGCTGDAEPPPAENGSPVADTTASRSDAAPAAPDTTSSRHRPGVPLATLIDAALHRAPGQDALPVLDRLAAPIRFDVEPRQNRHEPAQTDTVRTYVYDGLHFDVYDVTGADKEIFLNLTVTDSDYATKDGLYVGMNRSDVASLLGRPDRMEDGTAVYRLEGAAPNFLRVSYQDDEVTRMKWTFYAD